MIKIIKEDKKSNDEDTDDKTEPINKIYDIEVPVDISATELNLENIDLEDLKNRPYYLDLLKRYEDKVNKNIDLENSKYQILLDNDIEIIGETIIVNNLLKISTISIPIILSEDEIKVIMSNFLTECYMNSYEDLIVEVTPEEYNEIYAEEISNRKIKPCLKNKENQKLLVNIELELKLDKLKIINT